MAEPARREGGPLDPLEPWFQLPGLPEYPLPEQLAHLYGGPFGLDPGLVCANFVQSLDGVAVVGPSSGSRLSGRNLADRFVMGLLRACADTILIGAGTLQGSPGHVWTAEHVFPPAAAAFGELRRRLGLSPGPRLAIVSGSGELELDHPGLRAGATILTSDAGRRRFGGHQGLEVISLGEGRDLDPSGIVEAAGGGRSTLLLTEGGPRLLGQLAESGNLDQLFLTVSPLLAGAAAGQQRPGPVSSVDLLEAGRSPWLTLLSGRRHGSHLFLRYRLEGSRRTKLGLAGPGPGGAGEPESSGPL